MKNYLPHLDFDDTLTAFSGKSDKELKRSYFVFSLISRSWVARIGGKLSRIALALRLPVKGLIRKYIFTQFCGGESLEETNKTISKLASSGVLTVLDYGIEGKETDHDFDKTAAEIKREIAFAKSNQYVPMVSCKMTGLARFDLLANVQAGKTLSEKEKEEWERVRTRFRSICQSAFDHDMGLFVDAEETWIQNPIDELVMEMMLAFNGQKPIVHGTIQMYRKDCLSILEEQYNEAENAGVFYAVKLVRGAYMEKERERAEQKGYPSPIQNTKADTDDAFNKGLRFAMERINNVAICAATHNEESSMLLASLISEKGMENDHPHTMFSQLYGMSDHITFNLAKAGFRAAKYIPYGPVKDIIPYLTRRAKENTSVEGQMSRELQLLKKEVNRRKMS